MEEPKKEENNKEEEEDELIAEVDIKDAAQHIKKGLKGMQKSQIIGWSIVTIFLLILAWNIYKDVTKSYYTDTMCIQSYCPTTYNPETETCPNPKCIAWIDVHVEKGFEQTVKLGG